MLCRRLFQAPPFARLPAALQFGRAAASSPSGAGAGEAPATPAAAGAAAPDRQSAASRGRQRARFARGPSAEEPPLTMEQKVDKHLDHVQWQSRSRLDKFNAEWRKHPGHAVPYRFRIQAPAERQPGPPGQQKPTFQEAEAPYSDFTGLRFPTLETAENFDYHKDRGLDRVVERAYPIKVPGYRRLDPYLREYIHFLHDLDPVRFTITRIAQRYRLREKTVAKVVQEWGANRYLTRSGLTKLREKQVTREAETLRKKEQHYAKWVGYDQLGDEDDPESDDEALGEYKGWRAGNDWIRRQNVEVEMMSAFPMMEKRDPMPKRVDIDLTVDSRQHHKIINWIDPTDKVVF
mmetsp:Transcript_24988/g.77712  ORF Transcript_24988/g.77712 Transcript_24988/m.77712 type:complete len:348 (-) Transcript_24988:43-1086(-)